MFEIYILYFKVHLMCENHERFLTIRKIDLFTFKRTLENQITYQEKEDEKEI